MALTSEEHQELKEFLWKVFRENAKAVENTGFTNPKDGYAPLATRAAQALIALEKEGPAYKGPKDGPGKYM